jgi:hypothetical protein
MWQAFVVGAEPSFVDGTLAGHLRSVGIDVLSHWSWDKAAPPQEIPKAADLVIVVKDQVAHRLCDSAEDLAKKKGVRFVRIDSKWSIAQHTLRLKNIITTGGEQVKEEDELALAVAFVKGLREAGRTPGYKEVVSALWDDLGYEISKETYRRVLNETAVFLKKPAVDVLEDEMTVDVAREAVKILLASHPEAILDKAEILSNSRLLMRVKPEQVLPKNIEEAMLSEAATIREGWKRPPRGREAILAQMRLKMLAAKNIWEKCLAEGKALPVMDRMAESTKKIFGSYLSWEGLKKVKEDFLESNNLVEIRKLGGTADGTMTVEKRHGARKAASAKVVEVPMPEDTPGRVIRKSPRILEDAVEVTPEDTPKSHVLSVEERLELLESAADQQKSWAEDRIRQLSERVTSLEDDIRSLHTRSPEVSSPTEPVRVPVVIDLDVRIAK